jgi:hypothetical protein
MGEDHLDMLDDIVVRRIRGKFYAALSTSDTLASHPLNEERKPSSARKSQEGWGEVEGNPLLNQPHRDTTCPTVLHSPPAWTAQDSTWTRH